MSEGGGAILGPAITLAKDLGILEKIALLITPQYRVAAEKLAEVTRELERNYQAIEDELQQLANLSFQFTDPSVERTKKLENLRPALSGFAWKMPKAAAIRSRTSMTLTWRQSCANCLSKNPTGSESRTSSMK